VGRFQFLQERLVVIGGGDCGCGLVGNNNNQQMFREIATAVRRVKPCWLKATGTSAIECIIPYFRKQKERRGTVTHDKKDPTTPSASESALNDDPEAPFLFETQRSI